METTVSIPSRTKYYPVIKTTKCSSWVVQTCASQIQDGGRPPFWKNRHICATRLIATKFSTVTQFGPLDRSEFRRLKIRKHGLLLGIMVTVDKAWRATVGLCHALLVFGTKRRCSVPKIMQIGSIIKKRWSHSGLVLAHP